jgi:exonuclease III
MKIISWNINRKTEAWYSILDSDADVVLLQEATEPPPEVATKLDIDPAPWRTSGYQRRPWRAAIAVLSKELGFSWILSSEPNISKKGDFEVSRLGTVAAVEISQSGQEPIILISMYAVWETLRARSVIYADASAHRIISDLSTFIGSVKTTRIIAAGDLNILHGYGEHGDAHFAERYRTIFDRFSALGLDFVGPQHPNGRQAAPWPKELPISSENVPTYYTANQGVAGATRQLDFVFASTAISDQVNVTALNSEKLWGVSDHCRLEITI